LKDENPKSQKFSLGKNEYQANKACVEFCISICDLSTLQMWANEDQAWRFLVDDNPKTPVGDESKEASGAEAWLEGAKKVALSHRLLAALIDEEEPAEGKEEEKVSDVATVGMEGRGPLGWLAGPLIPSPCQSLHNTS
jgi:hypothetical protein